MPHLSYFLLHRREAELYNVQNRPNYISHSFPPRPVAGASNLADVSIPQVLSISYKECIRSLRDSKIEICLYFCPKSVYANYHGTFAVTVELWTNGKPTKKVRICISYYENPLKIHRPSLSIELKAPLILAALKTSLYKSEHGCTYPVRST